MFHRRDYCSYPDFVVIANWLQSPDVVSGDARERHEGQRSADPAYREGSPVVSLGGLSGYCSYLIVDVDSYCVPPQGARHQGSTAILRPVYSSRKDRGGGEGRGAAGRAGNWRGSVFQEYLVRFLVRNLKAKIIATVISAGDEAGQAELVSEAVEEPVEDTEPPEDLVSL